MMKHHCDGCTGQRVCCSQHIFISRNEYSRLKRLGTPVVIKTRMGLIMNPDNEVCSFLKDDLCSIYEARPKSCRKFFCKQGPNIWPALESSIRKGLVISGIPITTKAREEVKRIKKC